MTIDARPLWCPDSLSTRVWYGWLAGELGASPDLPRPFLICVRGVSPAALATHENIARPGYPDTGILVYRGNEAVFPMSSVPYQTNSGASPDVDGDGHGDVACIKPGRYVLTDKGLQPYPVFVLTNPDGTDKIACSRDLRHDGRIDHEGPAVYSATAILLHTGLDGLQLNPPSEHTSSVGCQTAPLKTLNFLRERAKATGSGVIDYRLIDAPDAIELMKRSPFAPQQPPSPNLA